tara:strand:+ start:1256 stop:1456 length:201 start_codon:yes stop_codon:yes gene_type:complete
MMAKKTLKINFEYGCEKVLLEWKGFNYTEDSFIYFMDRFLDFFPYDLEIKKRVKPSTNNEQPSPKN